MYMYHCGIRFYISVLTTNVAQIYHQNFVGIPQSHLVSFYKDMGLWEYGLHRILLLVSYEYSGGKSRRVQYGALPNTIELG